MTDPDRALERLQRRLDRERKARRESEAIAERVTAQLYSTVSELERVNAELGEANRALEAANESIKEFVAVASHDLRGPLTVILGATTTLLGRGKDLTGEQRADLLESVRHQGANMQRLVEDLLIVSRLEVGAVEAHIEDVCIRMELERLVQDLGPDYNVAILAPRDLLVRADPGHLERILGNYLSNAFKYGQPPIEVQVVDAGAFAEIRIRDHGAGVPPEFIHRLFGKFARAEQERVRRREGTGLGLSIVRGLARTNGGDAWYEPNLPSGACFAVRLPKAEPLSA